MNKNFPKLMMALAVAAACNAHAQKAPANANEQATSRHFASLVSGGQRHHQFREILVHRTPSIKCRAG